MSTNTLDLREFGGVPIAQGSGETFWNFGWVDNPGYASFAHPLIEASQGFPMTWDEAVKASLPEDSTLPSLDTIGDDDGDVFLWKAEESLRGKLMPSLNQREIGSCFPAGTLVLMADGTQKAIETVKAGDVVVSHLGNHRKVIAPTTRRYTGKLYTLMHKAQELVTGTACHKFYSPDRGWLAMEDMRAGDNIVRDGYVYTLDSYEPVSRSVEDFQVYCLNIEEDHSFIANGFYVHNCVAVSYARTVTDLIAISAVQGLLEWPGINVAPEPIYGGSRVEVGRGVLGSSDGSLGSWASSWLLKWGVLLQQVYGSEDLTEYSVPRCRSYGVRGCPDHLEPIARQYPVKGVALVTTGDQLWKTLGSWYPVNVCSNRGFTTVLRDGFCEPSGSWAHAMTFRGRFIHPTRGKCVVIQNSWGDYLRSIGNPHSQIETRSGKVQLPEGCFATTLAVAHSMVAQRDSYALSDVRGLPTRRLFFW